MTTMDAGASCGGVTGVGVAATVAATVAAIVANGCDDAASCCARARSIVVSRRGRVRGRIGGPDSLAGACTTRGGPAGADGRVAATPAPVTPPHDAPASIVVTHEIVATHELDEPGAGIVASPRNITASVETTPGAPALAVVHAPASSSAAPALDAASATIALDLATSSAVAPLRVRGRVVREAVHKDR